MTLLGKFLKRLIWEIYAFLIKETNGSYESSNLHTMKERRQVLTKGSVNESDLGALCSWFKCEDSTGIYKACGSKYHAYIVPAIINVQKFQMDASPKFEHTRISDLGIRIFCVH